MEFLYPSFLFALTAIAVPIIIHLFNFRRFKKIFFPNVRLLKNIQQENQTRNRLRNLLILLSRILAIAALVLAFAGPFVPKPGHSVNFRDKLVGVYIDNSFSMESTGAEGGFLDDAKRKAVEIANAFRPSDQFILLSNDFESRHQRLLSRDEFISAAQEIKVSPSSKKVSELIARFNDLSLNTAKTKILYVVSDFRKSMTDLQSVKPDTTLELNLVPLKADHPANLYIDSCWFYSPVRQLGKTETLFIRLKNESEQSLENIPLKLFIDEKQKGLASFNIGPYGQVEVKISFQQSDPGIHQGRLEILDNPVVFDDRFFFSYSVYETIPVLSLNSGKENVYLRTLFGKDSLIQYKALPENNIDYSVLPRERLIILDGLKSLSTGLAQELQKYIVAGGNVLIFPAPDADVNTYRPFLASLQAPSYERLDTANSKVNFMNLAHPVFQDVFEKVPEQLELPAVFNFFRINAGSSTSGDFLMRMQNGLPFLYAQTAGRGKLYLSAVPLDDAFSNFPKQAIFVPVLYKIAVLSLPEEKLYLTLGQDDAFDLSAVELKSDRVFKVRNSSGNFNFVPEQKYMNSRYTIFFHNQVKEAGNYLLESGDAAVCGLSFNYNRSESKMDFLDQDALKKTLTDIGYKNAAVFGDKTRSLTQSIIEMNQGKRLWKIFILIALFFIAVEIALIRLWKMR